MPLYPTLEDLKVTELLTHQSASAPQLDDYANFRANYSSFMGLDLSAFSFDSNGELVVAEPGASNREIVCAPVSGDCLVKEAVSGIRHGLRRLIVTKNSKGKVGVQLKSVDTGIFICFVLSGSPAAEAGLRFGDQIIEINDVCLTGMKETKAMSIIDSSNSKNISFIVRDRPFERIISINKDSSGSLGFTISSGTILAIKKGSSAARNGLLTNHQLVEVDGQNVVGVKDKHVVELMASLGNSVTLTIMPKLIYDHMIKKLGSNQLRNEMDHSVPDA